MIDIKHCSGCRNNVYNQEDFGGNMVGGKPRCWQLEDAKLIKRKRVPVDQRPPWTQLAEMLPSCYSAPGYMFVQPHIRQ